MCRNGSGRVTQDGTLIDAMGHSVAERRGDSLLPSCLEARFVSQLGGYLTALVAKSLNPKKGIDSD